jgi:Cell division protein
MIEMVVTTFNIIEKIVIGVVIALILVTAFLISNTIKLTIFSRKSEIEIMRLVGASNIAIKLPFLVEGLIIGVVGSIIPICISIYGYVILYSKMNGYIFSSMLVMIEPYNFVFYVSLILLGIGALVGMYGSVKAVRKYLKI